MSGRRVDLAARYLDLVVRLLPSARRTWGAAMQAELDSMTATPERVRFALSCTRGVLLTALPGRGGSRSPAIAVGLVLMLAGEIALAGAIGVAIPLALALALLAWLGRRPGAFGPVRPERSARRVRAGGSCLVAASFAALLVAEGSSHLLHPAGLVQPDSPRWGSVFALVLTLFAATFLTVTAPSSGFGASGLAAGACSGLIAGAVGFVVLPFERGGDPLAAGLPGGRSWLALLVFAAPCAAALVTAARTRRTDQAVMAALCGAALAALVVALCGLTAIVLFPGSVPDIVGPVMTPGTSAAARQFANATEASDPYFGLLSLGAMLVAMLCVMARPPRRADGAAVVLFLLGLPPIVLAASADRFPGSAAITFSILGLVLGAIVSVRGPLPVAETPVPLAQP
jgi:hypothetical protein